jgi:thioredoxin 1
MITENQNLIQAKARTFDEEVLQSRVPVVVDFYADWCAPCRMLSPVLQRLAGEFEGKLKFVKVNVDEEISLANRFRISGIPALFFFRDGHPVDSAVGLLPPEELRNKLNRLADTSSINS